MTTPEYGIQVIPVGFTNPGLPPGHGVSRMPKAFPGEPGCVYGRYLTRVAAETACEGWELGTWRVMVRHVTPWGVA